jgi:transcriptional regulator with XRE-family HTH domain
VPPGSQFVHDLGGNGDCVARVYHRAVTIDALRPPIGEMLRDWRHRRRLSQLELSLRARVSTRHLSFLETGRAQPSRQMVLHLAEQLAVPLRERNSLLLAAGYAPAYAHRELDTPELQPVRAAIDQLLTAHQPYPALVLDHHWGLIAANRALDVLTDGIAPFLLEPPVNVIRLMLHPDGLAPRILNLHLWRRHLLERVAAEALTRGDTALAALHDELSGYPDGEPEPPLDPAAAMIAMPLRIRTSEQELSFITTRTTFAMPAEITVAELSIESLYPADRQTARMMQARAARFDAASHASSTTSLTDR